MTLLTGQAGCWGQGSDPQGRGEARGRGRSRGVTRRPCHGYRLGAQTLCGRGLGVAWLAGPSL